jgi:hypothetical protein
VRGRVPILRYAICPDVIDAATCIDADPMSLVNVKVSCHGRMV